jgi:putative PEP-CTERM system TPR-repeat lipoprotein
MHMSKKLRALTLLASFAGSNMAMATEIAGSATAPAVDEKLLEEAKKYLGKGEPKAAVIELKNFLQGNPEHAEARLLIGEVYLRLGDGPNAARAFEKARELKAPKERWIVSLARAYLLQNDVKSVLEHIKPDENLPAPVRAQIHGLLGTAYLAKSDKAKAQENFDAALKLDPAASEALLGLAMLEAQQSQYKKTIEYANRVLAKDGNNANARIILGEAKRLDGDLPGAIEAFGKALQFQPNDVRARLGRATAYLGVNKLEDASKDIAEVRKTAGDLALALYLQAVIDFQHKKLDEAETLLNKVTAVMPDHLPSKLLLGTVAYQQGKLELADNQLSQFFKQLPKHLPAVKLLGATRMKLGKPAEAIEVLKGAEAEAKDDPQLLALLGSAYLQAKQFDLGTDYLNRAAELAPNAAAIKAQLGLGRLASGHAEQAVGDLKAAVDLDQNLLQADVVLVLALIQQKKYDEAIAAANKLKEKMKGDPLPDNLLGTAYMAQGNGDQAAESWKAALKLKPDYTTAAFNLAKLEMSRNNIDGAVKYYERILQRDANNMQALLGLAQIAESRKDYGKMETYLAEARDKNPKALQPALILSRHYLRQGKPLRSLEIARDAETNNPDNPLALENLGIAQMVNDQTANAVATFRKLTNKVSNNPEYRHHFAQALYKTGDKAAASQEWRRLTKEMPDYLPAYLAVAELDLQDKKFDEALKIAEQVKAKQPQSPAGPQLEGDAQFAQKQYKKAVAAYEKAYRMAPSAAAARRLYQANRALGEDKAAFDGLTQWLQANGNDVESWTILAMGYQSAGKPAEAVNAYEKAYALKPENPMIQNNLAWMYEELGDKRALPLAEKLLAASGNNPDILDTVGWIYVRNGRQDQGLTLLRDAAVHAPQRHLIRLHLAETLAKAGQKDEARGELNRLLKDKTNFPERQQAEALLKGL